MPAARKRALREVESAEAEPPKPASLLHRIRNMWQFANLFQFIMLFGKALKMDDDIDIEDLEAECLTPGSMALQSIGLGFLKFISSHRGLTHDLFDEYTRRQFLAKAPEKNPFGNGETPTRFADFDVLTKIRVLHHMTQIIMMSPERLREKTEEQKDTDQTSWRIEPYGWDHDDRTYFVLDDNRIYRLTEAPPPQPKPKKNTQKAKAAQRASKRRRTSTGQASDADDAGDEASEFGIPAESNDDGLGGMKWECLAVNLEEVRQFLSTIQKSKDPNEKVLRQQIQDHLVPILEKQEESRKRKQLQREKELLNLEKLAHAKRSSRIAGKLEQQKVEEHTREEERKRQEEDAARRKEEAKRLKMEHERDKRLMSREQRLKEREIRRIQHEEELAQLSEESKSTGPGAGRISERRRQAEIEKNRQALKELDEQEDDWIFDCVCGFYGQVDDGTHSVACERCNVWQHSKCLGIKESEAEKDDFHFVCVPCRKREETLREQRPRIIKIKVNRPGSAGSSPSQKISSESPSAQRMAQPEAVASSPQVSAPTNQTVGVTEQEPAADRATQKATKLSFNKPEINPFSSPHPNLSPPVSFDGSRSFPQISFDKSRPSGHQLGDAIPLSAGNGNGTSPSKQPPRLPSPPITKVSPAVSMESRELGSVAPGSLPHLTPAPSRSQPEGIHSSSPLLPPQGGFSPIKHSPPVLQRQANGNVTAVATPITGVHPSASVFPPAAALSPTPREQILTPPVKHADPVRASPQ
ncbi:hypothetical protein OQA88_11720 [Cercophora sp. LCS_1]